MCKQCKETARVSMLMANTYHERITELESKLAKTTELLKKLHKTSEEYNVVYSDSLRGHIERSGLLTKEESC